MAAPGFKLRTWYIMLQNPMSDKMSWSGPNAISIAMPLRDSFQKHVPRERFKAFHIYFLKWVSKRFWDWAHKSLNGEISKKDP